MEKLESTIKKLRDTYIKKTNYNDYNLLELGYDLNTKKFKSIRC